MTGNTHRPNCANAQNPGCVCSGCGGALHGWQGWTELAYGTSQSRDNRRHRIELKIEKNRTGTLRFNAHNRQTFIDLARLDVTDHLSRTGGETPDGNRPPQRIDIAGPMARSSDRGRLSALAQTILEDSWEEVEAEIDRQVKNKQTARDAKRHLADHTWCGLLIALIRWIEKIDDAVQLLADKGEQFVKNVLTQHLSGLSKDLADAVTGIVVDSAWSALAKLLEAHFPLLGEDTLRVLRMLALFACPAVDRHPEVYEHAAKPLMSDGLKVVSDEIKTQVTSFFTAWWRRQSASASG
ncbi:hypothetical protein GCM10010435_07210 [Winogradskya consettensis]|uniref:Uncharacterized protein n=1 Tax=Winogradskya consettensis TaxID=113560 RepID=A0A919VTZ3_9ACTN|nr:hypothetical protein [Actinoplanes consettensis]GIM75777.1 hypothetical protein Aco04nite_47030 [Actinoplanes consettensis]